MTAICPHGGKVQYKSEQHAKTARITIGRHGASKSKFRIYKCPFCFYYHLTSTQRV